MIGTTHLDFSCLFYFLKHQRFYLFISLHASKIRFLSYTIALSNIFSGIGPGPDSWSHEPQDPSQPMAREIHTDAPAKLKQSARDS
jgi:hypothetical protein